MRYFALVMSLAYVAVGALVLLNEGFLPQVSRFRLPLGIVLVANGVQRGVMWQRKDAQSRKQAE